MRSLATLALGHLDEQPHLPQLVERGTCTRTDSEILQGHKLGWLAAWPGTVNPCFSKPQSLIPKMGSALPTSAIWPRVKVIMLIYIGVAGLIQRMPGGRVFGDSSEASHLDLLSWAVTACLSL